MIDTHPRADPVIAVVNSNDDTAEMLRECLCGRGFRRVVKGRVVNLAGGGADDFLAFVTEHRPSVFVYDIPIPYEQHWAFLHRMAASDAMKGCRIVLTTTNKQALESMVGPSGAMEVLGKPYDLDQIVSAVEKLLD